MLYRRDSHEVVHRIHKSARTTLSQVWLEVTTWSMDLVAFWATVVFPITYFYPEEHIYRTYISIYPGTVLLCTISVVNDDPSLSLIPAVAVVQ